MLSYQPLRYSIDSSKPEAVFLISKELSSLIINQDKNLENIIILCIGTDRSTGDCLGPLVGDKLSRILKKPYIHIFGTLKEPIHAKNLETKINDIYTSYNNPLVIAVDASLGKFENIGKINIFNGPLFPGAGVNKNLISVGDISITGIVNISGFMEYLILQSTRLSLVMQLADTISLSIFSAFKKINNRANYFLKK
ncbi:MAG: spore protease YyaC [Caloramator sp.]|nr:spore protease YyaC [Caloramator sp.]